MNGTGKQTHIRGRHVLVERAKESRRREVRRQSPRIYAKLPEVIVDWVAVQFANGGWPIRRDHSRESRFVMDTILCHYVFIPCADAGRARVLVWPRVARMTDIEYTKAPPTERYELARA